MQRATPNRNLCDLGLSRSTSPDEKSFRLLVSGSLLSAVVFLTAYLPALEHGFFVDDDVYVGFRNQMLTSLKGHELWKLLVERGNIWEFLPVRDFSYWIDMQLLGYEPAGFHASNLAWYVFCGIAVYRFLTEAIRLYLATPQNRTRAIAALASLMFFAHPAHVEVVVWVSGRKDILATGFAAMGAAYFLAGIRKGWNLDKLCCAVPFFILSVFSKSVAVFFVAVLCLVAIDAFRWIPHRNKWKNCLLYVALPALVAGTALVTHLQVGGETGIGLENAPGLTAVLDRASRILVALVGILLFPYELRLIYDVYAYQHWHWGGAFFLAIMGLLAILAMLTGRRSFVAFGVAAILIPLIPYLQFAPYVTWSLASERFVFQASLGLVLVVALVIHVIGPRTMLAPILAVVVIGASIVSSRVLVWESPKALRQYDLRLNATHHSAAREYVLGHLLPERQYGIAREIARGLADPSAQDLMERTILSAELRNTAGFVQPIPTTRTLEYCRIASPLEAELRGFQRDSRIADVTFINYVGHLRAYLNGRGHVLKECRLATAL